MPLSCNIISNHYPFIGVTVIAPLIGGIYLLLALLFDGIKRQTRYRGGVFSFYMLILIPITIMFGLALFKAAYDYTYMTGATNVAGHGTVVFYWRAITSGQDLLRLEKIVECLAPFMGLAGFSIGLSILPLLARKLVESWPVYFASLLIGPLFFVYLESMPVERMYYSYWYAVDTGLPVGSRPFDLVVWPVWSRFLYVGLVLGVIVSVTVFLLVRIRSKYYKYL